MSVSSDFLAGYAMAQLAYQGGHHHPPLHDLLRLIMTKLQEYQQELADTRTAVLQAIADEAAQVTQRLTEIETQLAEGASATDVQNLIDQARAERTQFVTAVASIYTPAPPPPAPEPAPEG